MRDEEEATRVDILGVPFNLVLPDGAARNSAAISRNGNDAGRLSSSGIDASARDAPSQSTGADSQDRRARGEEMTPGSTLKVAALWLVLISQLWLLLVFWNDPMGTNTSAFLQD